MSDVFTEISETFSFFWQNNLVKSIITILIIIAAAGFVLKYDMYKSVKQRFDSEGIEIPFPYRTLVFKDKNRGAGSIPFSG